MTQLEKLKVRLNLDPGTRDADLKILLDDAKAYILGYTRRKPAQWLPFFDSIQLKIAIIDYNREGVEGFASRSEGGISTGFLGVTDYPDSIVKTLNPYRLVKGVSSHAVSET